MYHPQIVSDLEGAPSVIVTLDARQVNRIAMLFSRNAEEHRARITENILNGDEYVERKIEAQGELQAEAGKWIAINDLMEPIYWAWADGTPADLPLHPEYVLSDEHPTTTPSQTTDQYGRPEPRLGSPWLDQDGNYREINTP